MKLLGLKARSGKPAGDADIVADLVLKPGAKLLMMGCGAGQLGRVVAGRLHLMQRRPCALRLRNLQDRGRGDREAECRRRGGASRAGRL